MNCEKKERSGDELITTLYIRKEECDFTQQLSNVFLSRNITKLYHTSNTSIHFCYLVLWGEVHCQHRIQSMELFNLFHGLYACVLLL